MAQASNSNADVLSPPPTQRCRKAPDEIKKHETLYFEDGDIVLMSLPKNHLITSFRVDKVFLSRYSPVFKDMFSLPSPNDVDKYEGVPFVRLQDEADHLVSFLNALYDPLTIPYRKHDGGTVSRVEGTLKLCTKYQVDGLRRRIIDHLLEDWPSTLDRWDLTEKEISAIASLGLKGGRDFHEPCSVIRLARECDIPELLPAAFYHLSRIPPTADLDIPRHAVSLFWFGPKHEARFRLLSRDDLMCVVKGSRNMASFVQRRFRITLERANRACLHRTETERCEELLSRYSKQLEVSIFHKSDPLETLSRSNYIKDMPEKICTSCRVHFGKGMDEGRAELWKSLPKFFGFAAGEVI